MTMEGCDRLENGQSRVLKREWKETAVFWCCVQRGKCELAFRGADDGKIGDRRISVLLAKKKKNEGTSNKVLGPEPEPSSEKLPFWTMHSLICQILGYALDMHYYPRLRPLQPSRET